MSGKPSIIYVDVDISSPFTADIYYCRMSARLALFCCNFDAHSWQVRKTFIELVHRKFKSKKNIALLARLTALPDEVYIDYAWEYRVERLVKGGLHLEHTLWTLSTYGGAVSAMADFMKEFASKALRVSLKQREIARRLDSPVLLSRCNMYIGLALAQMGYFSKALSIIKQEYNTAVTLHCEMLKNCASGLWVKVQSMKKNALDEKLPAKRLRLEEFISEMVVM